jgi:hypothetical protein
VLDAVATPPLACKATLIAAASVETTAASSVEAATAAWDCSVVEQAITTHATKLATARQMRRDMAQTTNGKANPVMIRRHATSK